jgi:opacity protein-like surface antigen
MRRGCYSLVAVLCLVVAPTAYGQFFEDVGDFVSDLDYYVGFDVGGSFSSADVDINDELREFSDSDDDSDEAIFGTVRIGAETGKWRSDIAFTYRDEMTFKTNGPSADFKTNVDAHTIMVSAYYDLFNIEDVAIFLGGGVGTSLLKYDTSDQFVSGKDDDVEFAWQIGFGADYDINENMTIEGGYRYVDLGDVDADLQQIGFPLTDIGDFEVDLAASEVYLGFRYRW